MNKRDINIKIDNYLLNCRAMAIIKNEDRILFQKREKDKYWALPGGKISVGESISDTIDRELKEELGISNFRIKEVCIIAEHFFEFNNEKCHQYIFGQKVSVDKNEWIFENDEFKGIEDDKNLIFKWIKLSDLELVPIKPDFLGNSLRNLDKDKLQFISYTERL